MTPHKSSFSRVFARRMNFMNASVGRMALSIVALLIMSFSAAVSQGAPRARWSEQAAQDWYAKQPWLVGSNYIPADAINELEMWQADTFDPTRIDLELGWAESLGMNTMRVFLHDLTWQQDPAGFQKRIDTFLAIAQKHHIRPMLVIFDSCWDPVPEIGSAARADSGGTQFGVGAESGSSGAGGSCAISSAGSICERRGRRIRERRSNFGVGRVERAGRAEYRLQKN